MSTPNLDHVFENVHGEPKTWDDLRGIVAAYLTARFPGTPPEDIDDAVSDALCDLVDYWVTAPGSLSESKFRNWNFAIRRAKWTSVAALHRTFKRQQREMSLEMPADKSSDDATSTIGDTLAGVADDPQVRDEIRQETIRRFFTGIEDDEWENFVLPVLRGEGVRRTARRTGRQHQSVARSFRRARRRLERRAVTCGALRYSLSVSVG